jgi:hypothetical protein
MYKINEAHALVSYIDIEGEKKGKRVGSVTWLRDHVPKSRK